MGMAAADRAMNRRASQARNRDGKRVEREKNGCTHRKNAGRLVRALISGKFSRNARAQFTKVFNMYNECFSDESNVLPNFCVDKT